MSYVFGPVPSRRLGRSLGVDLVPFKTCSYDCIYCQLGRTTHKTIQRKQWVPLEKVLADVRDKLQSHPDYITLSGSGEPTLFSRTGELIDRIKDETDIPVAVLTNGSLLWQKDMRDQLLKADLVIPSLDAGSEAVFLAVNRPHKDINFAHMLEGLVDFRKEFTGQYWLEIMILNGYTSDASELHELAACVDLIKPDRVQLNTVMRPPAEDFAVGVSKEQLATIAGMFSPRAEIIADFSGVHEQPRFAAGRDEILQLLRRRPCSVKDIAEGLGMHRNEVVKYIEDLTAKEIIIPSSVDGILYYKAKR